MAHIVRDKQKLRNRVRRIRGQLDAIERAIGEEQVREGVGWLEFACIGFVALASAASWLGAWHWFASFV